MLDQLAVTRAEVQEEMSRRKQVEQELQELRQFVTEKMARPPVDDYTMSPRREGAGVASSSVKEGRATRPTATSHKEGVTVSIKDIEVRGVPEGASIASTAWLECVLNGQSQATMGPPVVENGETLRWQGQTLLFKDSLRVLRKPLQFSVSFGGQAGETISYRQVTIQDAILAKKCELRPDRGQQQYDVGALTNSTMVVSVSLGVGGEPQQSRTSLPPSQPSSSRKPSLVELAQGIGDEASTSDT